ncbi:FAD binding domain protein [Rhodotorula toruloides]|uniref:FAD binding domain protein n=1 Tax=Rhodotorula toruloides TaxID=5286 RepID=A0A511K6T0_RHOTO|nr:FAD binding domain protein [Rhodotorula toruloides]
MLFHPSPADVDALVAYASRTRREDELEPIKGVVRREFSKYQRKKRPTRIGRAALANERERQDYYRPLTSLFHSFIRDDLVNRYNIASLVTHTSVNSLSYGVIHIIGEELQDGFVVRSVNPDGTVEVRGAEAVVMAIGPSNKPFIPPVLRSALPSSPPSAYPALTSAQIVDPLLSQGVSFVTLVSRSHIKTKHFDFDLPWVSKYANVEKMAAWQEEDPALRFELIRRARAGGSVNPQFARVLQKWTKYRRLDVKKLSEVTKAAFDMKQEKWTVELATTTWGGDLGSTSSTATTLNDVNYLVCLTGSKLAIDEIDFLEPTIAAHPVETVSGLPVLTKDLQ